MPPPRQRDRDNSHRKTSRSMSPPPHKHKRSWQSSSIPDRPFNRSSPPRKKLKSPQRFRQLSTTGYSRKSRSRSPKYSKRNAGDEGSRYPSKGDFKSRSPVRGGKAEFGSRLEPRARKRSLSPRNSSRNEFVSYRAQEVEDRKPKNVSRSPDSSRFLGLSSKKKPRQSSPPLLPPMHKRFPHARSPSLVQPPKKPDSSQRPSEREVSIPQRKVSTVSKKKASRMTLHKRFTTVETEPYHLNARDNVTIAILRNPHAEPSEDATVQRIFDSSLFKMIHKKTEGKKPIFDREEIKLWCHDENLDEDPDFEERRLVRVKSIPKKPVDNLIRMSPDILRKRFGLDVNDRPKSRSPNVSLNPQPDSRYESRYQQQINREEVDGHKRRKEEERRGGGRRGGGDDAEDRFQSRGEDRVEREDRYSKGDDYDLRQALERRRSGRDEDFERDNRYYSDSRRLQEDDRNVVMDKDRDKFDDLDDEDRGRRREGWKGGEKRRGWGRGRGRGPRRQWSPRRNNFDDRDGHEVRDRGYEKRERFSLSPVNVRGRGGGGGFRGRDKILTQYEEDRNSPPTDDYYKYTQHDDRDVSPKGFRGRGRGGSFRPRGFRGTSRGFRGGRRGRGFRSSARGRGFFRPEDSRSVEKDDRRSVEHASEREWKHDMYESVQSDEEELPHSTTVTN